MPSPQRLPVSAKKRMCYVWRAPQFHCLLSSKYKESSISTSTFAAVSRDVKARLKVVLVSRFAQMPHGAWRPSSPIPRESQLSSYASLCPGAFLR